jgi:hypothetical protein
MKSMRKALAICGLLVLMLAASGCGHLDTKMGGVVVGALYGRSGVFVTNDYEDAVIEVNANNGASIRIGLGQTAQLYSAGLLQGDRMFVMAKFYDKAGHYLGSDSRTFTVYYGNGGPWVKDWVPTLRRTRVARSTH